MVLYFGRILHHYSFRKSQYFRQALGVTLAVISRFSTGTLLRFQQNAKCWSDERDIIAEVLPWALPGEPCVVTGGVTLVGTEAPLAVVVVAAGGGAPELAVAAPRARARLVLVPEEDEGEHTGSALGIATNCGHGCANDRKTQ